MHKLPAGICLPVLMAIVTAFPSIAVAETLELEVRETAGIRRFGYPVEMDIEIARPSTAKMNFRLLEKGRPVTAQFRPYTEQGNAKTVRLNFNTSLLPYEKKTYTVEYGEDVPQGPQQQRGLSLTNTETGYLISHRPHLHWTIEKNLRGLLPSLKARDEEQMRETSPGLILHTTDGKKYVLGSEDLPVSSHIVRDGRIAIDLRFQQKQQVKSLPDVESTVDLQFVNSKSWVRVDWVVEDPEGQIASLESVLHVDLDKPEGRNRTLVDFGATSYVYVALNEGQQAVLSAFSMARGLGPPQSPRQVGWRVLRGGMKRPEPFVSGRGNTTYPEGWAHLMDREKCLAVAVDQFARSGEEEIRIAADGTLSLKRHYAGRSSRGKKRYRFWLHFVTNPPHVSAATSPQSMQIPLDVDIR